MSHQLVKKGTDGKYNKVMPKSWIEGIKDKNTGQKLEEILQGFNMYFLSYTGNTYSTRLQVPKELRRKGLWITYVKYDNNVYTEWYASDKIEDEFWKEDSNWRIGNNMLVGDISISANGNWVINGSETKFKAIGEKGNTPLLRIYENILQVSYDLGNTYISINDNPVYTKFRVTGNKLQISTDLGKSWTNITDYIAAWFRWQATTGDTQANNVGRMQLSRDEGKTWSNVSNDFINNLHISKYIGANETLPTSGIAEGTIYAKGPFYAEDDTLNDNPIYRLWVYAWKDNVLAWQDNGEFTSISAGVVQETGNSETEIMSQKATTENLLKVSDKVDDLANISKLSITPNNNSMLIVPMEVPLEKDVDYIVSIEWSFIEGTLAHIGTSVLNVGSYTDKLTNDLYSSSGRLTIDYTPSANVNYWSISPSSTYIYNRLSYININVRKKYPIKDINENLDNISRYTVSNYFKVPQSSASMKPEIGATLVKGHLYKVTVEWNIKGLLARVGTSPIGSGATVDNITGDIYTSTGKINLDYTPTEDMNYWFIDLAGNFEYDENSYVRVIAEEIINAEYTNKELKNLGTKIKEVDTKIDNSFKVIVSDYYKVPQSSAAMKPAIGNVLKKGHLYKVTIDWDFKIGLLAKVGASVFGSGNDIDNLTGDVYDSKGKIVVDYTPTEDMNFWFIYLSTSFEYHKDSFVRIVAEEITNAAGIYESINELGNKIKGEETTSVGKSKFLEFIPTINPELTILEFNNESTLVHVSNENDLKNAISRYNQGQNITISLDNDIYLNDIITIEGDSNELIIKGNNHYIYTIDKKYTSNIVSGGYIKVPCNDLNNKYLYLTKNKSALALNRSKYYFAESTVSDELGNPLNNSDEGKNEGIYRFKLPTELYNMNISDTDDVYVNVSCWFTSFTAKVIKVEEGYLYFHTKGTPYNVNSDYVFAKLNPSFFLINYYKGQGNLYFKDSNLYYPIEEEELYKPLNNTFVINKGKVKITNVQFLGNTSDVILSSGDLLVTKCSFYGMSESAIHTLEGGSIYVLDSKFTLSQKRFIKSEANSLYTYIRNNEFKNAGLLRENTTNVSVNSREYYISDNVFEDFGYAGVGIGILSMEEQIPCGGIVERNIFKQSLEYSVDAKFNTLMDSGAIYIATNNNPYCIIRDNRIINYNGRCFNRGIFADDGAYNIFIYSNIIENVRNAHSISARYATGRSTAGNPDNINKIIANNIVDNEIEIGGNPDIENNGCYLGVNVITSVASKESVKSNIQDSEEQIYSPSTTIVNGVIKTGIEIWNI